MKRGEIWLLQLDPTLDREIGKTRPALIVNDEEIFYALIEKNS